MPRVHKIKAKTFWRQDFHKNLFEILPIYTCLCYFDNAQLEIIPGSHKYNNNGSSINSYCKKKIKGKIYPGKNAT